MNLRFVFVLSLFITTSFAQSTPEYWKGEIKLGDGFLLTTTLNVKQDQNHFIITSPENADKRLFGGFKSALGRLMGKIPRKGIFFTVDATQSGDSLNGTAKAPVLGNLKFKGIWKDNYFSGDLIQYDTVVVGTFSGKKTHEEKMDYRLLYPEIVKLTQDNIYDEDILHTKDWLLFQKDLEELCTRVEDDIELYLGFSMLSNSLPFSHYKLFINAADESEEDTSGIIAAEPTVIFEKKDDATAYLKIKNFSLSQAELAEVLPKIVADKSLKNLIIDLRNNSGGGIEAAFEFARFISSETIMVGYFVTNKLEYQGFEKEKFEQLSVAEPQTTEEFIEFLKRERGAKLIFQKPDNAVFTGNIYILTNSNTASTCEPIAHVLKSKDKVTLIGKTTAGAMLSSAVFDIYGKYKLILPMADFYTHDGVRLEGVGVKPDIDTSSEEALRKALELIGIETPLD